MNHVVLLHFFKIVHKVAQIISSDNFILLSTLPLSSFCYLGNDVIIGLVWVGCSLIFLTFTGILVFSWLDWFDSIILILLFSWGAFDSVLSYESLFAFDILPVLWLFMSKKSFDIHCLYLQSILCCHSY